MAITWVDITDAVRVSTSDLPVGGIVIAEHFSLFDAMAALEIGDPKMDIGAISCVSMGKINEDINDIVDDDAGLPVDLGRLRVALESPQNDEFYASFLDQLFVRLTTHLNGYLFLQTITTCSLIATLGDNIADPETDPLLVDLLKLFLSVVDQVKAVLHKSGAFDDEDFDSSSHPCIQQYFPSLTSAHFSSIRTKYPISHQRIEFICFIGRLCQDFLRGTQTVPLSSTHLGKWIDWLDKRQDSIDPTLPSASKLFDRHHNRHMFTSSPPRRIQLVSVPEMWNDWKITCTEILHFLNTFPSLLSPEQEVLGLEWPIQTSLLSRNLSQIFIFKSNLRVLGLRHLPPLTGILTPEAMESTPLEVLAKMYTLSDAVLRMRGYTPSRQYRLLRKLLLVVPNNAPVKSRIAFERLRLGFFLDLWSIYELVSVFYMLNKVTVGKYRTISGGFAGVCRALARRNIVTAPGTLGLEIWFTQRWGWLGGTSEWDSFCAFLNEPESETEVDLDLIWEGDSNGDVELESAISSYRKNLAMVKQVDKLLGLDSDAKIKVRWERGSDPFGVWGVFVVV